MEVLKLGLLRKIFEIEKIVNELLFRCMQCSNNKLESLRKDSTKSLLCYRCVGMCIQRRNSAPGLTQGNQSRTL